MFLFIAVPGSSGLRNLTHLKITCCAVLKCFIDEKAIGDHLLLGLKLVMAKAHVLLRSGKFCVELAEYLCLPRYFGIGESYSDLWIGRMHSVYQ